MPEPVRHLVPGQNVPIPDGQLRVRICAGGSTSVFGCVLGAGQKAESIRSLVSAASPQGPGHGFRLLSANPSETVLVAEVGQLPSNVTKIIFCVMSDDARTDVSHDVVCELLSEERAFADFLVAEATRTAVSFLGEAYRKSDQWKFRALGQDFKTIGDFAAFIGLSESDVRNAARKGVARGTAGPASPPAPVDRSRPSRPASSVQKVSSSPPVGAGGDRTVSAPEQSTVTPAIGQLASFACRDWILTAKGIVDGSSADVIRPLIERELLDVRLGNDGAVWPAAFSFDPSSGDQLRAAPRVPPSQSGGVRIVGTGDGRAVVLVARSRTEESGVPTGARLFATGGNPARLVAIDPVEGRSWWKAPLSDEWVGLGRVPSVQNLPTYAIGATGTAEGVFYAASKSLVHLLAGQASSIRTTALDGDPVAPPFAIGAFVAVPVVTGSGLAIQTCAADGRMDVVDVENGRGVKEPLGVPVGDTENGRAFWVGRSGYLAFEDVPEARSARWNPWPPNVEGLPFLPSYRARNGRLWAFCVRTSGNGLVREGALACSIAIAGAREVRDLPGPIMSVGDTAFRGRERHRDPWSRAEEEINLGLDYTGRWLLPLARIGERQTLLGLVAEPRSGSTARDFVFREGAARQCEIALALHTDDGALELLRQTFEISTTDDLDIYRDGDRICVHHAESDTCVSWPLSFSR